jgi:hypothetical protein
MTQFSIVFKFGNPEITFSVIGSPDHPQRPHRQMQERSPHGNVPHGNEEGAHLFAASRSQIRARKSAQHFRSVIITPQHICFRHFVPVFLAWRVSCLLLPPSLQRSH